MPQLAHRQRFQQVMRTTQALSIVRISERTTITQLDDVISIDAIVRLALCATPTILDCFALAVGSINYYSTPANELRRIVDRVHASGWQTYRACVNGTQHRRQCAKLAHGGFLTFQCISVDGLRSRAGTLFSRI